LPFFLNVTISLDVLPGPITGVFFPLILKSWATWPAFLKTNVTLRGVATDLVESLKKNSPPLTVTVVALSYAGTFTVTVSADPDQVPDLPVLASALQEELDALSAAPAPSRTGRPAPAPMTEDRGRGEPRAPR